VRDLLRADGVGEKVGGLDRAVSLHDLLHAAATNKAAEERGRDATR
jgi:hypothetical protein